MNNIDYQIVIGLEVHVQLATKSKLFCGDETHFGNPPNTQISEVSLAYPGTLPVLNKKAVDLAIKIGLATSSEIASEMLFDRKNYFYPDLPKGYQITQDRSPICVGGFVPVKLKSGEVKNISLTKIHLEEDAGKSVHDLSDTHSMIDYNRAGMPLIELVTDPVMSTLEEVGAFMYEIRRLVRYLGIGDGNMEEGSLRCDANISLKRFEEKELGSKVEIKNLNSIKNVQRALTLEIDRQKNLLDDSQPIVSETRLFDVNSGVTRSMRKKETLTDYRYFTDPDLPITKISAHWKKDIQNEITHIPWELESKLVTSYGLPPSDARVIADEKEVAEYFLELGSLCTNYKTAANWVMGPIKTHLNTSSADIGQFPVAPNKMAELITLTENGTVNQHSASKVIFPELLQQPGKSIQEIVKELGLVNDNKDDELALIIDEVLAAFPKEAELVKSGRTKLIGMFMGQIMKKLGRNANPTAAKELLLKKIGLDQ